VTFSQKYSLRNNYCNLTNTDRSGSRQKYLGAVPPPFEAPNTPSRERPRRKKFVGRRGVEYGEGCPLPSRLGVLGSVVSFLGEVGNSFWRILKARERSYLHQLCRIWGVAKPRFEGAITACPNVEPNKKFKGTFSWTTLYIATSTSSMHLFITYEPKQNLHQS